MNRMDKVCVEYTAKLHASWKQYSINILTEDEVHIFINDAQAGAKELCVSPDLLRELSRDVGLEYDSTLTVVDSAKELIRFINDKPKLQIIRTIHPVGQGAMYSERFLDKDGKTVFLTVYDCGSDNFRKLEREISSSFIKSEGVDLLFISHLDKDHVNGLRKLMDCVGTIKNVVLPLTPSWLKPILLLMADDEVSAQIITSPEDFFKDSNTIYVRSAWEMSAVTSPLSLPLQGDSSIAVDSGTRINSSAFGVWDWCYIPYNYDEVVRINAFLVELQNAGITESDLSEPYFIDENRNKIQEIYRKVCGSVNDSSLVVYSGGFNNEYSSRYVHNSVRGSRPSREACLYLGDVDIHQISMNAKTMVDDLKDNLISYMVNHHIGTIQLPHHGSIKNFHNGLLSYGHSPKVYFASFGQNNQHGHPSTLIAGLIASQNENFCAITEARDSALIQIIK